MGFSVVKNFESKHFHSGIVVVVLVSPVYICPELFVCDTGVDFFIDLFVPDGTYCGACI